MSEFPKLDSLLPHPLESEHYQTFSPTPRRDLRGFCEDQAAVFLAPDNSELVRMVLPHNEITKLFEKSGQILSRICKETMTHIFASQPLAQSDRGTHCILFFQRSTEDGDIP